MKLKGKNAISLIVLVITIIVLSILAATVIISISNTNVISETSKTVFKSDMSTYKEAYEVYVVNRLVGDAEFDRTKLNITYQDSEYSDIFGTVPDRYKEGLKVVNGELVYESTDEAENEVLEEMGMKPKEYISKDTSYVGYFADTDGDGEVDGVIFADLAHSSSGTWDNTYGGGYSYTAVEDTNALKDYVISQESYTARNGSTVLSYGTKPVIKAVAGSGQDRFYVMALSDFTTTNYSEFYWYYSKAEDAPTNSTTSYSFGSGKQNTHTMISTWNNDTSSKNNQDVWNVIQQKVYGTNYYKLSKTVDDVIWFLPSAEEWGAFIYYLQTKEVDPLLSSNDRSYYNLSSVYKSSSEGNNYPPYWFSVGIDIDGMMANPVWTADNKDAVRLATTF